MSSPVRKMIFDSPSQLNELELNAEEFKFFADLMYQLSGVNLPPSEKNRALVKNRLAKLMRKHKLNDYSELVQVLKKGNSETINEFISSLTTNKTHFFREESHFQWLESYLKTHFQSHAELRLWCAAASTGQEPYTLAMLLRECLTPAQLEKTKFLATDIDLQVLRKAAEGVYTPAEMEGCPSALQSKYFESRKTPEPTYRAKDDISKMIRFAPLNLVQDNYPFQHKFHIIFCRNVLIYFDPPTTKKVIDKLASSLLPGGHLILGHSESGTVKNTSIKSMSRAIYQKTS